MIIITRILLEKYFNFMKKSYICLSMLICMNVCFAGVMQFNVCSSQIRIQMLMVVFHSLYVCEQSITMTTWYL